MKNIRLTVQYDGTDFVGFQKQPRGRTIQGVLEQTITSITKERVDLHGSGRTDSGVHALGQVCNFMTTSTIPPEHFAYVMRTQLPRELQITKSEEVDIQFHARKSAYWKKYVYHIVTDAVPDLFKRRYQTHLPRVSLDVIAMQQAAHYLEGEHDFTSFCSTKTNVKNRIRTLYHCFVTPTSQGVTLEVIGNGFLFNMVRIIAGTLVKVGRGLIKPEHIPVILMQKNREYAGPRPTLAPEGLVLMEVGYSPFV